MIKSALPERLIEPIDKFIKELKSKQEDILKESFVGSYLNRKNSLHCGTMMHTTSTCDLFKSIEKPANACWLAVVVEEDGRYEVVVSWNDGSIRKIQEYNAQGEPITEVYRWEEGMI